LQAAPLGIGLHSCIAVVHGLFSFSFMMVGALILYLRPWDEPFESVTLTAFLRGPRLTRQPTLVVTAGRG